MKISNRALFNILVSLMALSASFAMENFQEKRTDRQSQALQENIKQENIKTEQVDPSAKSSTSPQTQYDGQKIKKLLPSIFKKAHQCFHGSPQTKRDIPLALTFFVQATGHARKVLEDPSVSEYYTQEEQWELRKEYAWVCYTIGELYEGRQNTGIPQDLVKAEEYAKRSFEAGFPVAVGLLYNIASIDSSRAKIEAKSAEFLPFPLFKRRIENFSYLLKKRTSLVQEELLSKWSVDKGSRPEMRRVYNLIPEDFSFYFNLYANSVVSIFGAMIHEKKPEINFLACLELCQHLISTYDYLCEPPSLIHHFNDEQNQVMKFMYAKLLEALALVLYSRPEGIQSNDGTVLLSQDVERSKTLLKRSFDNGYAYALVSLRRIAAGYHYGKYNIQKDLKEALALYEYVIEKGRPIFEVSNEAHAPSPYIPRYQRKEEEMTKTRQSYGAALQGRGKIRLKGISDETAGEIILPRDVKAAETDFKQALLSDYPLCIIDLINLAEIQDNGKDGWERSPEKALQTYQFIVQHGEPLIKNKKTMEFIGDKGIQDIQSAYNFARAKSKGSS